MSSAAGPAPSPRLFHPLCGADPLTLLRLLAENPGIPRNRWPHLATIAGSVLGRGPVSLIERLGVACRADPVPNRPPPVFIIGHWRSGTTHLYNIMSRDPGLGYLPPLETGMPWDMFTIVSLFRPLLQRALPEGRYIDNVPVNPDSPQEDEVALANMSVLSYYQALYFPKRFDRNFNRGLFFDDCDAATIAGWERKMRHLMKKLALRWPDRRLLVKNPTYTARVPLLARMFPEARFIHIYRNPYVVFASMRNFYARLLENFALQEFAEVDVDAVILNTYRRMMDAVSLDGPKLPANRFAEIRFEDFEQDPMGHIADLYDQLELDGHARAEPLFRDYLGTITDYKKNRYAYADADRALVDEHWGGFVDRWGYAAP